MSTITRRFTLTTARESRGDREIITLGRGVEFEGKDLSIEVHVLPVGNWWPGVALLVEAGKEFEAQPQLGRRFDLVAGKRTPGNEKTQWLKVGIGMELVGGGITIEFNTRPEGNWWDGRLRLFEQKADKAPRRSARSKDC